MDKNWLATRSAYVEGVAVILLLIIEVALLIVFTIMIVHLVLTAKHLASQHYSSENAYVRICEYLFTGQLYFFVILIEIRIAC